MRMGFHVKWMVHSQPSHIHGMCESGHCANGGERKCPRAYHSYHLDPLISGYVALKAVNIEL